MNYNPSPKSEFLKSEAMLKQHHILVENPYLRDALDIALKEMQRRAALTDPANFNACAAAHLRMLGAQEFLDTFLNLAETQVAPTRTDTTNLPSNAPTVPGPHTVRKN